MKPLSRALPLSIFAVCLIFFASLASAQTVGADGSFNYTIPIELPDGTAGMAPELAFVYSSNSDNGMLGVGWSLAGGLPAITRDSSYVINYNGSDNYIGPGGRLVLINETDGIYHYENESFCKIQEFGAQADGPSYWVETKPDGTKYYYGYTEGDFEGTESKILAVSKTYNSENCIRAWALSKVEDLYGNYYEIQYIQDNGAYYPYRIIYTMNSGLSDYRVVEFLYEETRGDYYSNCSYGSQVLTKKRLKNINTYIDVSSPYADTISGTSVRTYTMNYDSTITTSTAVKSRLESIIDTGREDNIIKFGWINQTNTWTVNDDYKLPVSIFGSPNNGELIDVDGDGLLDCVLSYIKKANTSIYSNTTTTIKKLYKNTGSEFNLEDSTYTSFPVVFSYPVFNGTTYCYYNDCWAVYTYTMTSKYIQLADVDGNGLTDIISGTSVYENTASGWSSVNSSYMPSTIIKTDEDGDIAYIGTYADINSDGLTDCILSYKWDGTTYRKAYINSGKSNSATNGTWGNTSSYYLPASVLFASSANATGSVAYSCGSGYTCYSTYIYTNWATINNKIKLVDINGDGYTDCINDKTVYLNTGSGISSSANSAYTLKSSLYSGSYQIGDLADVNGDGLLDCVISYKNSSGNPVCATYLNTGYGFSSADSNFALKDSSGNYLLFANIKTATQNQIRLVDINGDGLTDVIVGQAVYLRSGSVNNQLMKKITDFSGGSITVNYSTSTKSPDEIITDNTVSATSSGVSKAYTFTPIAYSSTSSSSEYPYVMSNSDFPYTKDSRIRRIVSNTIAADGRDVNTFTTNYSYDTGKAYMGFPYERKDLYFECVTSQTEDGPYTKTYYNQIYELAGKIDKIEDYDSDGNLMKYRQYYYGVKSADTDSLWPYSGTTWAYLGSETEYTYEKGKSNFVFSNTKAYQYDYYGNPTKITSTADGLEQIVTDITYALDADAIAANILNRPASIVQTDITNSKLLKKQNFEYYQADESAAYGKGLKFKLKEKRDWKDSTNYITTETYTYDNYGNIKSIATPNAAGGTSTTVITYDNIYQTYPVAVTDSIGTITTAYNYATGNKTHVTDYNGYTTYYEYDSQYKNRLINVYSEWINSLNPGKLIQKIDYVDLGKPATQYIETTTYYDNALTNRKKSFKREYIDGLNRKYKTASTGYNDEENNKTYNRIVTYEYDSLGRLSKQSNPYLEHYDDAVIYYTTIIYDNAGRVKQKTYDGDGVHSGTTYESFAYGYGPYMQQVTFTDKKGVDHVSYYDARGRLRSKSEAGSVVDYEYDAAGRLTKTYDPGDNITSIGYDGLGRKISITEKSTGTTSYTYYDSGHIKTQTNQRKDPSGNYITITNGYDSANRLTHEYSSESTKTVDTTYTYDTSDTEYHTITGLDQTNLTGRLSSVTDKSGKTIFSYDANGNVAEYVKKIIIYSSTFGIVTVKNEYDLQNRVTAITYPDGSVVKKHYADSGYLKSVTDGSDNPYVQYQREIEADYAVKRITGNGVKTTITYDPSNLRPYEVITQNNTSTLEDVIYAHDNLGNILGLSDQISELGHTDETETFTYDSLSRLRTANSNNFYGPRSYDLDAQGNLTKKDYKTLTYDTSRPHLVVKATDASTGVVQTYGYDAAGNMTSRAGKTLVYDAKNRLIKIKNSSGTVLETYTYDYTGFRVKKQSSDGSIVYNVNGIYEVKWTSASGNKYIDYIYGLNGELAAERLGGEPVITTGVIPLVKNIHNWKDVKGLVFKLAASVNEWFKEPAHLRYIFIAVLILAILGLIFIWVYNAFFRPSHTFLFPAWITHAVPVLLLCFFMMFGLPGCFDMIFGDSTLTDVLYYHPNHVGSIKMITNYSQGVVARYYYTPYGELLTEHSFGTEYSKYKYTAQELDSTTGLYYYNARFYDPAIGRFISADSIVPDSTDTQDFNRYMYASGNPIKCLDPTGHDSEDSSSSSSYYPGWYVSLCNYINSSWFGSALAYVSNAISSLTGYYPSNNYPGITPPSNLITANTGANNDPSKSPAAPPAVGGNIGSPVAVNDGTTGGPDSTASELVEQIMDGAVAGWEDDGILQKGPNVYIVKLGAHSLYESLFFVEGQEEAYAGSTLPDDIINYPTVKEGEYSYTCIEHDKYGKCLIFNSGGFVPVNGDSNPNINSPNYGTPNADWIYVHTGYYYEKGSQGCLTIFPQNWSNFMNNFNVGDVGVIQIGR